MHSQLGPKDGITGRLVEPLSGRTCGSAKTGLYSKVDSGMATSSSFSPLLPGKGEGGVIYCTLPP